MQSYRCMYIDVLYDVYVYIYIYVYMIVAYKMYKSVSKFNICWVHGSGFCCIGLTYYTAKNL